MKLKRNEKFEYQRIYGKISGYTTTYNAMNYPFKESIQSMLGFCDEVVVVDGSSEDGTWEALEKLAEENSKLKLFQNSFDWEEPGMDGMQKAFARALCENEFLWQCVKPGTKIQTITGEKNIEDVMIGEKVLTHTGQFKPVLKTYKNNVENKKMFNIKKLGDNRILSLTDNHPVYLKKKDNSYTWKNMTTYSQEEKFVFPKLKDKTVAQYEVEIPNGRWTSETIEIIPNYKLGYLAGLYLGDGWVSKDKDEWQYLSFSFNLSEIDIAQKASKYISEIFNKKPSLYINEEKNEVKLQIGNKGIAKWFYSLFNTGSHNKCLDSSVYAWRNKAIFGILDGYLDSDGSCDNKYMKFDSVNSSIISQLKVLFTKIGMFGTISSLKMSGGFLNESREIYRLAYSGKQLSVLGENTKREKLQNQSKQFFEESDAGFEFNAYTEITEELYTGTVYNLEVEKDNSYVANGIVVHNCDVDEVVHEDDYEKIKMITKRFPANVDILHLPIVELWGDSQHVTGRRHSWKWRMSRNKPEITHGINKNARQTNEETGRVYAKKGMSDGCEYVNAMDYEMLPHTGFYNNQIELTRIHAPEQYAETMNQIFEKIPSVYHYSWCSMERKLNQLKKDGVWDKMWSLLYQEETQDRFPGAETEEHIKELAQKLSEQGGEDTDQIKFKFKLNKTNPAIMNDWLSNNKC